MKTVGIMTWYRYCNYGTALQAVALSRVLKSMGCDAVNIAYDPEGAVSRHRASLGKRVVNRLRGTYPIASDKREASFSNFINENLTVSEPVESMCDLKQLGSRFSAVVCGSDQIWSPRSFDPHYYLDFIDDPIRKIAYAPSFGCEKIEDGAVAACISELLAQIGSIAVREESGAELVERAIGKKVPVVVDPTLLLDAKQWESMSRSSKDALGRYCLFYFLGADKCNWEAASKIANAKKLEIRSIPVFTNQVGKKETVDLATGPAEFLSLVANAELVCTDSFHGLVFASIFRKPFISFERFDPKSPDSQNTRVYNYLNSIGAWECLLERSNLSEWNRFTTIVPDYTGIAKKMSAAKAYSMGYLRQALIDVIGAAT